MDEAPTGRRRCVAVGRRERLGDRRQDEGEASPVAETKHILLLTEDDKLRRHLRPIDQWLNFHAPVQPVDALEHVKDYTPDIFLVDAEIINTMVTALLGAIREVPRYKDAPVVVIGDSPMGDRLKGNRKIPRDLNLRRVEQLISELLNIRLVGRGTHGPHRGSAY